MLMFIMCQNGGEIVNTNNVMGISLVKRQEEVLVVAENICEVDHTLGYYTSEAGAKEALAELLEAVEYRQFTFTMPSNYEVYTNALLEDSEEQK